MDNVHTQSKRMVSISPEPNFWMHICVNLASTPKASKKSKEANKTPLTTTNYYHQESVPDALLRDYLLQGYEEFKLFHGTFLSNLSAGRLQRQLERFFTPWTWQLDLGSSENMYYRSGPHVHSADLSLRPVVSDFAKTLPSDSLPILLTSSHLVTFSDKYECPSSLLKYLWSVSRSADAEMTIDARQTPQKPDLSSGDGGHDDKPVTSSSFFGPGIGSVMNIKKWSWPGSLTFGGTAIPETTQRISSDVVTASDTSTVDQIKSETLTVPSDAAPDHKATSPVQLDQSALDEAMATTHDHSIPTNEDGYVPLVSEGSDTPGLFASLSGSTTTFTSKSIFLPGPHILDPQPRQLLYISALHSLFALVVDASWSQEKNPEFLERLLFNTMRFLRKIKETLEQNTSVGTVRPRRSDYILRFQPNITYADGVIAKEGVPYLNENNMLMQGDDVQEIFSRPQSPKAWFVSKRYPNLSSSNRTCTEANFVVNIKEASLIGANNEIESVIQHFNKR